MGLRRGAERGPGRSPGWPDAKRGYGRGAAPVGSGRREATVSSGPARSAGWPEAKRGVGPERSEG